MVQIKMDSGKVIDIQNELYEFVRLEALEGTRWTVEEFFLTLGELVDDFGPINSELLSRRVENQNRIDSYYQRKRDSGWSPSVQSSKQDAEDFEQFLLAIGYIKTQTNLDFQIDLPQLDEEMTQNGPELVTPVTNAGMAVGGANARWGSLYDAYFLSDIHPEIDKDVDRYARLEMVVKQTNAFLDEHVIRWEGNTGFDSIVSYSAEIDATGKYQLIGHCSDGSTVGLQEPKKFIGLNFDEHHHLSEFFLSDNGLRLQFQLYDGGKVDPENGQFKDLIVESAITTIVDFEDAATIVDAADMVSAMRNYLGLMRGDLVAHGSKGNLKTINFDKSSLDVHGQTQYFKGCSLMSVRNVSIHMYTDMVQIDGHDIPERILGILLTTLIASTHAKNSEGKSSGQLVRQSIAQVRSANSAKGYIYQVTPKLQTSEEVAEQIRLFKAIENRFGLSDRTILIGIMNEELGMTLQLSESLHATEGRAFFINTGFLDRTASQIRVQMHAGPINLRDELTQEIYNTSYELHNVDVGIRIGIHKHGKIGKGMQVRNRAMSEMLEQKIAHPQTGANTAWVPAPNPSHLHSMHYHMVDVDLVQRTMEDSDPLNIQRTALLSFPVLNKSKVSDKGVREHLLLRYIHSMLAYAEPWVNRGIGCSGVRNFDGVEEMKDRATERIDGAIIANWKLHEVISQTDIENAIAHAVKIVNEQNAGATGLLPITNSENRKEDILKQPPVASVLEVIDEALYSDSGYVEPALFRNRKAQKYSSAYRNIV